MILQEVSKLKRLFKCEISQFNDTFKQLYISIKLSYNYIPLVLPRARDVGGLERGGAVAAECTALLFSDISVESFSISCKLLTATGLVAG